MKPMNFWRALLLAAAISVIGAVLHSVLPSLFGNASSLRLTLLTAAAIYLLALLISSPVGSGRVVGACVWLALSALLIGFDPPLSVWLLLQTGYLWLLRSLTRYPSLIPAGIDAVLSGFALAASIATAVHTHSLLLSLWSYFLVQALATFIPSRPVQPTATRPGDHDFDASYRNAEAALRRLSMRS